MIKDKYAAENNDIRDPQENPFHEDLSHLDMIMQGMVKRTKEAETQVSMYYPWVVRLGFVVVFCSFAILSFLSFCLSFLSLDGVQGK